MSTGDVGHFDDDGRLFIDGRDDDMIVSGGENLFPGEVEELLITHPAIVEAAVIGVDDEEFGKRLAAYVVVAGPGGRCPRTTSASSSSENLARFKVPRDVAVPRRAAAEPERQGAQAGAARPVRRRLRAAEGRLSN